MAKSNLKGKVKKCLVCHKDFYLPAYLTRREKFGKYCSNQCKAMAKRKRYQLTCPTCNSKFSIVAYRIHAGRRYCSHNCYLNSKEPSSIEIKLYGFLTNLRIEYKPQYQIERWTVDAYIPVQKLVVEADGKYWHNSVQSRNRDALKNNYLTKNGYNIVRLKEEAFITGSYKRILFGILYHSIKSENFRDVDLSTNTSAKDNDYFIGIATDGIVT